MSLILAKTSFQTLVEWLFNFREFELDNLFDTSVIGRAYEYVHEIKITNRTKLSISAISDRTTTYLLHLEIIENKVLGTCSCKFEGACKHMAALILSEIQD